MKNNNRFGYLMCTVLATSVLAGCASNKDHPSGAFLAPIEDQTLDIVGDVQFGLQLADSVLLNHYYELETPSVDAYSVLYDDLLLAMRAIVYYSVDLLDLADAAEGEDALEPLIELISTLDSDVRALSSAQAHLGDLDKGSVFAQMRGEENIIGALQKAQPLITEYADIITWILGNTDDALDDAVVELYEMIHSSHSPMLTYRDNLTARQNNTLSELQIMDRVWAGDSNAWADLLAGSWALSEEVGKNSRPTATNAKRAEQHLIDRLEVVATIRQQLEPAHIDYQNELLELYQVEESSKGTLRMSYLIIENWEDALDRLANGEKSAFKSFASTIAQLAAKSAASRIRIGRSD